VVALSGRTGPAEPATVVPSAPAPAGARVPIRVPVLELKFFPTTDGVFLDPQETTYYYSLHTVRTRVQDLSGQLVDALERGSVYVKDPTGTPSLDYSILESREFLATVPKSAAWATYPDYFRILNPLNVCDYVDRRGVREVWIWMYHTPAQNIDESNMAMGRRSRDFWNHGTFGNVSNSYQRNDMPVCESTYTVYDYNYSRGLGEALENHGHQIDVVLGFADNGRRFYWENFVQPHGRTDGAINHCGWVHMPPNTTRDYDWRNPTAVPSNCSDWRPDGSGEVEMVSCLNWGCAEDSGAAFKVWLMQRMPGNNNDLSFAARPVRNFWELIGDFDGALAAGGRDLLRP
jgi:hypothetical protein